MQGLNSSSLSTPLTTTPLPSITELLSDIYPLRSPSNTTNTTTIFLHLPIWTNTPPLNPNIVKIGLQTLNSNNESLNIETTDYIHPKNTEKSPLTPSLLELELNKIQNRKRRTREYKTTCSNCLDAGLQCKRNETEKKCNRCFKSELPCKLATKRQKNTPVVNFKTTLPTSEELKIRDRLRIKRKCKMTCSNCLEAQKRCTRDKAEKICKRCLRFGLKNCNPPQY